MDDNKKECELKNNKPKCSYCGSRFGYVRIISKEFQCRACSKITKIFENDEED